jgi:outer membrane immunogenic protein
LLAAPLLAAIPGAALAADLYVPPAAPPAPVPVATNWDGPYIGANIGYGWGSANVTSTDPAVPAGLTPYDSSANPDGFMIGAQAGYNFHASDNLVLGIEGALDWSNQTGGATTSYANGGIAVTGITQSIGWNGDIVARLGVDAGSVLPYVDAGVAFANVTRDATNMNPTFGITPTSASNTQVGWTAGVGVEAMVADNLSVFVSYNYADYGTASYDTGGNYMPSVRVTDNILKAGLNWHF